MTNTFSLKGQMATSTKFQLPGSISRPPTGAEITDFNNSSLSFHQPQRPYSSILHAAMLTLIHFRLLSADARFGAAEALRMAGEKDPAIRQLSLLRVMAFGPRLDDATIARQTQLLTAYPWGLTDHEFRHAFRYVQTGQWPSEQDFQALQISGDVMKVGGFFEKIALDRIKEFLVRFGPAALSAAITRGTAITTWGAGAGGFVLSMKEQFVEDKLDKRELADLGGVYEIERVRRQFHG